jgi:hypothetical protein
MGGCGKRGQVPVGRCRAAQSRCSRWAALMNSIPRSRILGWLVLANPAELSGKPLEPLHRISRKTGLGPSSESRKACLRRCRSKLGQERVQSSSADLESAYLSLQRRLLLNCHRISITGSPATLGLRIPVLKGELITLGRSGYQ